MRRRRVHRRKPVRRKPNRLTAQKYFITVDDYEPPWWTWLTGALIGLAPIAMSYLLGYGRIMGWW